MRAQKSMALLKATSGLCSMSIWGIGRMDNNGGGGQEKPQNNTGGNSADTSTRGNDTSQTNNGGNNTSNNKDLIDNIWQDIQDPEKKAAPTAETTTTTTDKGDPQKELDTYLSNAGLGEFKLSETELEAFKSGEGVQGVLDNINNRIRQSHIKALSGANELIKNQVEQAVKKAVDESKSFYQGQQLREVLNDKLPWTKDADIAPMAETVLRRLLEKGATWDTGIEGVKRYFERLSQKMDPNYQPPNPNTRTPFRGNAGPNSNQQSENNNWLSVLKGH